MTHYTNCMTMTARILYAFQIPPMFFTLYAQNNVSNSTILKILRNLRTLLWWTDWTHCSATPTPTRLHARPVHSKISIINWDYYTGRGTVIPNPI